MTCAVSNITEQFLGMCMDVILNFESFHNKTLQNMYIEIIMLSPLTLWKDLPVVLKNQRQFYTLHSKKIYSVDPIRHDISPVVSNFVCTPLQTVHTASKTPTPEVESAS